MATDYTEKELVEMQKKAIVQARDMHRRAYLISPEPESKRQPSEEGKQRVEVEAKNNPSQAPQSGGDSFIMHNEDAQPEVQNRSVQNHAVTGGPFLRSNGPAQRASQPQTQTKPSQKINVSGSSSMRHNEPAHSSSQQQVRNSSPQNSSGNEDPYPPPMRPQSRPGLNLGGLFNTGFKNYPPPKEIFKHDDTYNQERSFCADDCPIKKSLGTGMFGNMQGMDNDMMLILSLILILGNEGADQMLLFALLYILM